MLSTIIVRCVYNSFGMMPKSNKRLASFFSQWRYSCFIFLFIFGQCQKSHKSTLAFQSGHTFFGSHCIICPCHVRALTIALHWLSLCPSICLSVCLRVTWVGLPTFSALNVRHSKMVQENPKTVWYRIRVANGALLGQHKIRRTWVATCQLVQSSIR